MAWRGNPLLGYWRRGCEFPTKAEKAVEPSIAALGERYRHQYPFWNHKYFADFALLDRKLIIEVDGDSHDIPEQKEKDLLHELQVLELGWRVVRITNDDALYRPSISVQKAILAAEDDLLWFPDKAAVSLRLTARLGQLHRDYPHLLVAAAKQAKRRSQSGLKGAKTRRSRAAPAPEKAAKRPTK